MPGEYQGTAHSHGQTVPTGKTSLSGLWRSTCSCRQMPPEYRWSSSWRKSHSIEPDKIFPFLLDFLRQGNRRSRDYSACTSQATHSADRESGNYSSNSGRNKKTDNCCPAAGFGKSGNEAAKTKRRQKPHPPSSQAAHASPAL